MAYTYSPKASGNWNASTTWTSSNGGTTYPVAGDTVLLNNAYNVTITSSAACSILTISGSGTLAFGTQTLTVSGLVTLSGAMTSTSGTIAANGGVTLSGTCTGTLPTISINSSSTLTSNGYSWNGGLKLNATTITLLGNAIIGGLLTFAFTSVALNSSTSETLTANNGITVSVGIPSVGTAPIIFNAGTWTGSNVLAIKNPLTLNNGVILSGNVAYAGTSLTFTNGATLIGSSANLFLGSSCTINSNNVSLPANITIYSNITLTLSNTLTTNGSLTTNGTLSLVTSGIVCNGLTAASSISGQSLTLSGGTWSGGGTVISDIIINGNVTLSGTVSYSTGTISYSSGTLTGTATPILRILGSCTLNTGSLIWSNVSIVILNVSTITLLSNINALSLFFHGISITITGAYNINVANFGAISSYGGNITSNFNAGLTLNISNSIQIFGSNLLYNYKIISSSAGTPAFINYTGNLSNQSINACTFTDIQSTGKQLNNINGGVLTRTTNIVNIPANSFTGFMLN